MVSNSMMFRAASALTAVGIVLGVANWYPRPEAALAWTASLAMFGIMCAALRLSRRALRRSTDDAAALRGIPTAVVFAALMMGIPLALTLARWYGVVDDIDLGRRSTGVLIGAFLVVLGNVMPKNLPPLSSMRMRRRTTTGVSAARRLDVGALRSCVGDRLAGAVNRLRRNCDDRIGNGLHGRDHCAAPAPSQAAQNHPASGLN